MKINLVLAVFSFSTALNGSLAAAPPPSEDPFIWLEDAHGERAMNWVKAENAKTDAVLERDPRFEALFHEAKVILEAKDRIPEPSVIAGQIYNFWQDADHTHGIWRQTSQADFQRATPFLASISPYNNLQAGVNYPQALIWSTSKDDRVGPQHARKFAAKLAAMSVPYFYFEVIEGGHGAGATPDERAKMRAREYTYFWGKLGS